MFDDPATASMPETAAWVAANVDVEACTAPGSMAIVKGLPTIGSIEYKEVDGIIYTYGSVRQIQRSL